MNEQEIVQIFRSEGLYFGRMISPSKSWYRDENPTHVTVFNANVITVTHGKIWYGDLDVTKDAEALKKIAEKIGEPLFILREMDGRFENENKSASDSIKKAMWNTTESVPYNEVKA